MTQPLPPGAFAKALQDKRAAARRRRLLLWGIGGGLLLVALVAGYLAFLSPVFATRQVVVTGTLLIDAEEVRAAAAVPLDLPLARQDTAGITARVAALPAVKSVTVGAELPDTIAIAVTERAVAFQRAADGQVEWVDADGVVFLRTPEPSDGVVQVSAPNADERLLRDIATVASALPDEVRSVVTQLKAKGVDQIELSLTEGRTVKWGNAEESELKAEVLAVLLTHEAKVYDVSAPRTPTTR